MSIFNRDLKKRIKQRRIEDRRAEDRRAENEDSYGVWGALPFIVGVYAIVGALGLQVLAWYISKDLSDAAWMVMFAISAVLILVGIRLMRVVRYK